jgi:hypothetical protein
MRPQCGFSGLIPSHTGCKASARRRLCFSKSATMLLASRPSIGLLADVPVGRSAQSRRAERSGVRVPLASLKNTRGS